MSRAPLAAALLVLGTVAGCDEDVAVVPDPPRGGFEVHVTAFTMAGPRTALWDVALKAADGRTVGRVRLGGEVTETLTTVLTCDPDDSPHRVEVEVVGLYATPPEAPGAFGDPVPGDGGPDPNPGVLNRVVTCVAGLDTPVSFDVALMRPADQGFFDTASALSAGEVRDAVYDLLVQQAHGDSVVVWQQRITSSKFGDAAGNASYVGPCFPERGGSDPSPHTLTLGIVGLYGRKLPNQVGHHGDEAPPDPLAYWPVGPIARTVNCLENEDVFVQFDLTLARVVREGERVLAGVAGLVCEPSWSCAPDAPDAPTLGLDCRGAAGRDPGVYLAELGLRCGDGPVAPLDSTAAHAPFALTPEGDGVHLAWRLTPTLDAARLAEGPCILEARVTVDAATSDTLHHRRLITDGALPAGAVQPFFTWSVPVADAAGPRCAPATFDLDGPLTVTYRGADAAPRLAFPQWWTSAPSEPTDENN